MSYLLSVEMRHSVTTPSYIFRKTIDNLFATLTAQYIPFSSLAPKLARELDGFPPGQANGWLPLYTMVTFRPDISYATAQKKNERQNRIITRIGVASLLGVGVCACLAGMRIMLGLRKIREAS